MLCGKDPTDHTKAECIRFMELGRERKPVSQGIRETLQLRKFVLLDQSVY